MGLRSFASFLGLSVIGLTLATVLTYSQTRFQDIILQYIAYIFVICKLQTSTITTYLAGVQNHLATNDIPLKVWAPAVHQTIKGHRRDEAEYLPQHKKLKYPFTNSMILRAKYRTLADLQRTNPFQATAIDAAMCMGLMFLFRKSEYLTPPNGRPKLINNAIATLIAKNVKLWYGETGLTADMGSRLPRQPPDMISMYLPFSKNDHFGKGATRYFPAEHSNNHCMVKRTYQYIRQAQLQPNSPIFAGPRTIISSDLVARVMKDTARGLGIDSTKIAMHSLRIGGLVTLFAADVPDSLKQLAGRWQSPTSFVVYARATMQQFGQISKALNNSKLVTAGHIKMFYEQSHT